MTRRDESPPDDEVAAWIDRRADEFEAAWKGPLRPEIEGFLFDCPGPEARADLIRELIRVDEALRREDGSPPTPPEDYAARFDLDAETIARLLDCDPQEEAHEPVAGAMGPGVRVGAYTVIEEIGRGGMGVVYKARQEQPQRFVALKIVNPELGGSEVIARFEREIAALALSDHPNVVKVFDAGATADGRPYLAMEYVGPPLTKFCDETGSTLRQRLALFISVCDGVQHAHRRGVLHRDLKPSNVLVADAGSGPIPKVIDFGLAKALQEPLTDARSFTRSTQVMGTWAYMSPEQAQLNRQDIDVRSDVYSLGAMLYELLAGAPPFDAEQLDSAPLREKLQIIGEEDPPKPSTRITKAVRPRGARDVSRLDVENASTPVRGELDWIVMKALAKERDDRYGAAGELADDVRRFLADEPVVAAPPSRAYVVKKWVRRNPWRAAAAAVGVAALAAFAVERTRHASALEVKNTEVEAERGRAELERDAARVARDDEEKQRRIAQDSKREGDRLNYVGAINQAQRAWIRLQPQVTMQLLDDARAIGNDDGPQDYRGWEWHWLKRLCHCEKLLLEGHVGAVNCVTYSPDGALIASGSDDGTAHVWDAKTGRTLHVLDGHLHAVKCAAFSPDGRVLATGGADATVRLWDAASGAALAPLDGHVLTVNGVAFDPTGKLLATAGADDTIQIFDVATRRQVRVIEGHGGVARSVTFSPDGSRLASSGTDHANPTVRLWDVASGTQIRVFRGESKFVLFTPDGRRLIFGGVNDLRIVDVETGKIVRSIAPTRTTVGGAITSALNDVGGGQGDSTIVRTYIGFDHAALSRDGTRICTTDQGSVRIWDAATGGEVLGTPRPRGQGDVVAWSPDGRDVVTVGGDRALRVWSAAEDPEERTLVGHADRALSLAFSADGARLASCGFDQSVRIWDVARGAQIEELGDHRYVQGPPMGGRPADLQSIVTTGGHTNIVNQVAFSPDGRWLASASQDQTLRVWDTASRAEKLVLRFSSGVMGVAWSRDGKRLAAGVWDDAVHLFDFPSGQLVRKFEGHEEDVQAVAFLQDGKLLVSAGRDKTVRIWDVESGRQLQTLRGDHLYWLSRLAVSPDERFLAVAGMDMAVTVWDTATWKEVRTLWGHTSPIEDLAFSPDGRRLASAGISSDDGVKLWDVATGRELLNLPGSDAVAFSPDGRRLVVGAKPHEIRIYETSPIDDQAYRTGPFKAPTPGEERKRDDGKLRALGYFTSGRLPGKLGLPPVVKPRQSGQVFLLAVVSLPQGQFVPSEAKYAEILKEDDSKGYVSNIARQIAIYDPSRFRLRLPKGDARAGELVGVWPRESRTPWVAWSVHLDSSRRIPPHDRVALMIAWALDPKMIEWPISVQIDEAQPVALPDVTLRASYRMAPPPPALTKRITDALAQVKTEKYADAVTAAASAALDADAEADTIYDVACVHALAAAKARQDPTLPETARAEREERLALAAVEFLRQSVARGFDDVAHIEQDKDLDGLRLLKDYRDVLERLGVRTGPIGK